MRVEDMKGGYTTGSCATAGMKAGLLALLDKNIVDQVVIENPQGQYICLLYTSPSPRDCS